MEVSFRYSPGKGFVSTVPGKYELVLRDPNAPDTSSYSPTEFQMFAMGACSSADLVTILPKMRVPYDTFSCTVEAERRDEHPKTLKFVNIKYNFTGNPDADKVRKAIKLSLTKYCHVSILAHRGGADLRYTLIIDGKTIDDRLEPKEPGEIKELRN